MPKIFKTLILLLFVCCLGAGLVIGISHFFIPVQLKIDLTNFVRSYLSLPPIDDENRVESIYFPHLGKKQSVVFYKNGPQVGGHDISNSPALQDFDKFMTYAAKESSLSAANWTYYTHYILLRIVGLDPSYKKMQIVPMVPAEKVPTIRTVSISCPYYSSAVVAQKNRTPLKAGVDVFEEIVPRKDLFYAYCLDKDCNKIGNSCIVIKMGGN